MEYIDYEDDETELVPGNDRKWVCREQMRRQYRREYYFKHKDEMDAAAHKWQIEHPERCREQRREYYQKNKINICKAKRIWRRLRKSADHALTA